MPRMCMAQEVRRGADTVTWERDAGSGERDGSMYVVLCLSCRSHLFAKNYFSERLGEYG